MGSITLLECKKAINNSLSYQVVIHKKANNLNNRARVIYVSHDISLDNAMCIYALKTRAQSSKIAKYDSNK